MTIVYSNNGNTPLVHSEDCSCSACADVRLLAAEIEAPDGWFDLRREMTQHHAEEMAERLNNYLLYLADQHDDMLDWRWSIGDTAI